MHNFYEQYQFGSFQCIIKQLLDSVFCHILNNKGFSKCNQSTLIIPGITKTPSNNCLKFGSTQIIDGSAITNCRCSQLGCTEIVTFWLLTASLHQAMRWRSSVIFGWKFASTNQKKNLVQGSDVSIKWNFCARPSDVISRENRCWRRGMSAVFSGYYTHGVLGIGWNLSIEQCVSFFFSHLVILVHVRTDFFSPLMATLAAKRNTFKVRTRYVTNTDFRISFI